MNKMKVCFPTTSYPRFPGDYAGKFIHNLAKELVKNKTQVIVIAPHHENTRDYENIDGVEIYRFKYWFTKKGQRVAYGGGIPFNITNSVFAKIQLISFLFFFFLKTIKIAKKCDIIHAQFLLSGFISVPIKLISKKPLITTVHGSDVRGLPSSRMFFFMIKQIDNIISTHPELTDKLNKFLTSQKISEIPNIVDFGKYEKEESKKSIRMINKEFELKNEKIVTYIARFIEMKDPTTFIKSIPSVIKKRKDVKFFLVGDGPLMSEIKDLINKLKIQPYVILTGFREDIGRFLKRSNIFIAISNVENIWSMTLVEAIKIGVPCIITSVGYTNKIFKNLENGYLIPSRNDYALSLAILELLEKADLRKKIANNAKILIKNKGFINQEIVENTKELYNNLFRDK